MIITRFAPSPTGFLHIGSARTALFNYLFSKHHGGKFLLRIEDTDKARSTEAAKQAILDSLKWLDLEWDGEVVYQSKRSARHAEAVLELLNSGKAYYCFSSQEEIDIERQRAISANQSFLFQSPWRDAEASSYPQDRKPAVRLKAPREGATIVQDLVQGAVRVENSHLDDMVLLRSDGTPTYMLAVVVDDHDMGITHVIRGDDHLTNTPRQIILYQAFGWNIPTFAHIPLIHGPDGAKLSKRHGAVGVEWYKDAGYLPEAMSNYLLRLGWSHGNDEIISRQEALEWFDMNHVGKAPSRLDFDKMRNLNGHYIKNSDDAILADYVISALGADVQAAGYIKQGMTSLKVRAHLMTELVESAKIYLFDRELAASDDAKEIINSVDKTLLQDIISLVKGLDVLDHDKIQEVFKTFAASKDLKIGEVMRPVRALLTGSTASPSVFEIIAIIGKEHTVKRLKTHAI